MRASGKPLLWLHGEVRTPPLSQAARLEAGWLLRHLLYEDPGDAEVGRRGVQAQAP